MFRFRPHRFICGNGGSPKIVLHVARNTTYASSKVYFLDSVFAGDSKFVKPYCPRRNRIVPGAVVSFNVSANGGSLLPKDGSIVCFYQIPRLVGCHIQPVEGCIVLETCTLQTCPYP